MMLARLVCVLLRHRTQVIYTPTEGMVRCTRCGTVSDRWPALRPEYAIRDHARRAAFWASVDAKTDKVRAFRKVR